MEYVFAGLGASLFSAADNTGCRLHGESEGMGKEIVLTNFIPRPYTLASKGAPSDTVSGPLQCRVRN